MRKSKTTKKKVILSVVLLLVAGALALWFFENNSRTNKKNTVVTAGQQTKGEAQSKTATPTASTSGSSSSTTQKTEPGDQKSSTGGTTATLIAPSGDFVSAHGKADDPIPPDAKLASVCNTTPGAVCRITFTSLSTGATVSLASEQTDRGGAAYWNGWSPREKGITQGSWKVTATATLNGQSLSSSDALSLEIGQ